MHVVPGLKVLYFGTPVVLISTVNPDGSANLAPMSSAWWLDLVIPAPTTSTRCGGIR